MTTVTITVADDGTSATITVNPRKADITQDPSLVWQIDSFQSQWKWSIDPPGIQMATTAQPPYLLWDGTSPQPGIGDTYVAEGVPNHTGVAASYKYTMNLVNSSNGDTLRIDPDIANDPQG